MIARTLRTAAVGSLLLLAPAAHAASPWSYIGQQIVPTGTMVFGTELGGLSGIDYNPATGRYFAISDDRSQVNPARFYDLSLDLGLFQRSPTPGSTGVGFHSATTILTPGGTAFAPATSDPEAIRFDGSNLYWTSEGSRTTSSLQSPFVREMTTGGAHVRELATPARFNPSGSGATDPGIRNNLAFESLALSTDGARVYTATESALVQDGPVATVADGAISRVIEFDKVTGIPLAQFAYPVAPIPVAPIPGMFADNGLVEMLAVGERQFITVERSFAVGPGNTIKLYYADARDATDISSLDTLVGSTYTSMTKSLLLDLADLRNDDGSVLMPDNIEGMTFGPTLNGKPTLILVSDNNFSAGQFTQFVALSQVGPVPEPETYALMLAGLVLVGAVARRRRTSGAA